MAFKTTYKNRPRGKSLAGVEGAKTNDGSAGQKGNENVVLEKIMNKTNNFLNRGDNHG